jgi:mono/diheme cytochrome c family protein
MIRTEETSNSRLARVVVVATLLVLASLSPAGADDTSDGGKLFRDKIRPLLVAKCFACHGADGKKPKGGLDLRTRDIAMRGGKSGRAAIVPGNAKKSPLYIAVTWADADLEMPPKENDRLNAEQIEWVRKWIDAGAPWPEKGGGGASVASPGALRVKTSGARSEDWAARPYDAKNLWAWYPVESPAVPTSALGTHPIDAFVDRKLREKGLAPAGRAGKSELIRRVTFDLIGLPPTSAEVDAFVADDSPQAFEKLVDRLLASPRYGERSGRHWLDVVRYADTSGFSNDYARVNAWRYRDWVIRAFNDDKSYDRFVVEQIAGDELDASNPGNLIAVGFLRMGPWEHTAMSVAAVTRQHFLDDVTNSVGVTFLGQVLRCARCHDHKFDPLPTKDYYRMQAVFAPVQFADRPVPYLPDENVSGFDEGRRRIEKLKKSGGVRSVSTLPESERPKVKYDRDTEKKGHAKVNNKRKEFLNRELKRYDAYAFSVYDGPDRALKSNRVIARMPAKAKRRGKASNVHILAGGSITTPTERVDPGVLSGIFGLAGSDDPHAASALPRGTNRRRLALARWIASEKNPLTARVIVNRLWQHHFGRGLAGNPNNFGTTGEKPSHPELLDWLASRIVEDGWSIKRAQRTMLLSSVYQRSSTHPRPEEIARSDPNGALLARFAPRRLTAEELRDSMLFASGELSVEMGGAPARPEINLEVAMQPRHIMGSVSPAYQPSRTPAERNRRTVYAEVIRTLSDPMLEVFNKPGPDTSCERRDSSTVTPQVFSLFNGQSSHDRALVFARRVESSVDGVAARVSLAFRLAFGRDPSTQEVRVAVEHVERMTRHHAAITPRRVDSPKYVIREMVEEMTGLKFSWVEDLDVYASYVSDLKPWEVEPATRALADFCLVLFNSNEFIYVY